MSGGSLLKVLPYDAEIEYLESTGTQLIDTLFGNNCDYGKLDIKLDFQLLTNRGSYKWVVFLQNETDTKNIGLQRNSNKTYVFVAESYFQFQSRAFSEKTSYHYYNYSTAIDNDIYSGSIPPHPRLCYGNIKLFGAGYIDHQETCRIWFTKISYDGILVRDLIPVRVGQVGYMYDKVSGQLFGNAGTGDFILGPDV